MAEQEKWVTFDDEESLSDLPLVIKKAAAGDDDVGYKDRKCGDAGDDFEFRISFEGGHLSSTAETADMCAADEVFFHGQILPLRPSVSSDNSLSAASRGPSRCGSLSESVEWRPGDVLTLGFNTSRSNSSSSGSSGFVSRSHSSNSHSSSAGCAPPLRSLNNFYSHPSPTPRLRIVRDVNAGRRSTGSAPVGWGIFRLGVVKAPEIDLYDLRSRRSSARKSNADVDWSVRHAPRDKAFPKAIKNTAKSNGVDKSDETCTVEAAKANEKKKAALRAAPRVISGFGFSCKCSPDDVGPSPASKATITRRQRDEEKASLRKAESVGRSGRMFEWLEELSTGKAATWGSS